MDVHTGPQSSDFTKRNSARGYRRHTAHSGSCSRFVATALLGLCLLLTGCAAPKPEPVGKPQRTDRLYAGRDYPLRPYKLAGPVAEPVCAEEAIVLGRSVEGRPIEMTVFGQGGDTTLIMGAFHGDEPTSAELACQFVRHLRANPELYRGKRVAVLPVVNPDGLLRQTRRNAHQVDLNRNFPASNFPEDPPALFEGGPYPGSERETRAVMMAVRRLKPARIVSIHAIARGRHGNNYDGPARALAMEMSRHNGYPVLATMGYPTPGSLGSWAGIDQQIPTLTLELPRDIGDEACWRENREALLAVIRFPVTHAGRDITQRTAIGK